MVPRIDMVVVKVQDSVAKVLQIIIDKGKSRLPVYEGSIDNVVGIVHARDLFPVLLKKGWKKVRAGEVMRAPHFVPVSKSVYELMKEFQEKKIRLGIVIDEYGGTAGLVSFEDFLEEIVGEMHDEHDRGRRESIIPSGDGGYEVDARINLEELNQKLNTDFPTSEDYGTLGGFVVTYLGRIPKPREWFQFKYYRVTVLDGDPRSVSWVKFRKI
jgi:magnesium and cobalt transporter